MNLFYIKEENFWNGRFGGTAEVIACKLLMTVRIMEVGVMTGYDDN